MFILSNLVTLDSLLIIIQLTEILLPLDRTTLFFIYLHIIILFICLLTNTGSCDKYTFIPVLYIPNFNECVTIILSLVTFHYFISDFNILDTPPSSFHDLLELSLLDPIHVFNEICFRKILRHNIRRVFFTLNILNLMSLSCTIFNVFIFYHAPQKMVTNFNELGMHSNSPIIC